MCSLQFCLTVRAYANLSAAAFACLATLGRTKSQNCEVLFSMYNFALFFNTVVFVCVLSQKDVYKLLTRRLISFSYALIAITASVVALFYAFLFFNQEHCELQLDNYCAILMLNLSAFSVCERL